MDAMSLLSLTSFEPSLNSAWIDVWEICLLKISKRSKTASVKSSNFNLQHAKMCYT